MTDDPPSRFPGRRFTGKARGPHGEVIRELKGGRTLRLIRSEPVAPDVLETVAMEPDWLGVYLWRTNSVLRAHHDRGGQDGNGSAT